MPAGLHTWRDHTAFWLVDRKTRQTDGGLTRKRVGISIRPKRVDTFCIVVLRNKPRTTLCRCAGTVMGAFTSRLKFQLLSWVIIIFCAKFDIVRSMFTFWLQNCYGVLECGCCILLSADFCKQQTVLYLDVLTIVRCGAGYCALTSTSSVLKVSLLTFLYTV